MNLRPRWRPPLLIAVVGVLAVAVGGTLALAAQGDAPRLVRARAAAGPRPPVTIVASPDPSTAGQPVAITGRLRRPAAGRRVVLWQRASDSHRFRRVADTTTDAAGRYRLVRRSGKVNSNLRWYVNVGAKYSRTISQRVHAALTLSATPSSIAPGQRVKLTGHVFPRQPGQRVRLQQRIGSRWRTIARPRLKHGGSRFTVRRRFTTNGIKELRIWFAGDRRNIASRSTPLTVPVGVPQPSASTGPGTGVGKIQHVIIVMQENRSFDSYFGTYPGAAGIPHGVCVPDPLHPPCVAPFHNPNDINWGGPHDAGNTVADVNGGKMDGFVAQAEQGGGVCNGNNPTCTPCAHAVEMTACDVMGYHDAREIPNYWNYAQNFVLQDHMFASTSSWSLPEHLYGVSGWAAKCSNPALASSCVNDVGQQPNSIAGLGALDQTSLFPWTDITYLLHAHNISWGYYIFQGTEPDCASGAPTCTPGKLSPTTPGIWNPLEHFTTVRQDNQLGNIQTISNFYAAAKAGTLPAVSWVIPNNNVSEHPTASVHTGQAYVTNLINTVMQGPDWNSTAIFVSWDDWGGFYDHVAPTVVDQNGYGIRVPGLTISPYAKQGYIDHQVLSHDAYLKFIEDVFLGGARLNPATDGRPDPRPAVRESTPALGDLMSEFDFSQPPRAPVLLPTNPPPGPASTPP